MKTQMTKNDTTKQEMTKSLQNRIQKKQQKTRIAEELFNYPQMGQVISRPAFFTTHPPTTMRLKSPKDVHGPHNFPSRFQPVVFHNGGAGSTRHETTRTRIKSQAGHGIHCPNMSSMFGAGKTPLALRFGATAGCQYLAPKKTSDSSKP